MEDVLLLIDIGNTSTTLGLFRAGAVIRRAGAVHPSDPAVALEVLDAQVEIAGPGGATRRCTIAELYAGAMDDPHGEMTLGAGELITAVELPAAAADGVQHWEKIIQRGAWDFSLIACAAARREQGR